MASEDGERIGREAPFPREMQGRWVDDGDLTWVVIVNGSEIRWGVVDGEYKDKKFTAYDDGCIGVTLEFADQTDSGDEVKLVALPDGSMYAYSDHFAARLIRPDT